MEKIFKDSNDINWDALVDLAEKMRESGSYQDFAYEAQEAIRKALTLLVAKEDSKGVIQLRRLFSFLGGGEPLGQGPVLSKLNDEAIIAAKKLGDYSSAGQFLHDKGQMNHRQGRHNEAIVAFNDSVECYKKIHEDFHARESYHMTALCYRALGNRKLARQIINQVLKETGDDLWRANPLSVLSWLQQDDGQIKQSEATLIEVVSLFTRAKGQNDVQVGQSLADLGEIIGFQGRFEEADEIFQQALEIFSRQPTLHPRQIARTLLKRAEVFIRGKQLDKAMTLLRQAYLAIAEAQYYDLLWRIQLAMAQINFQQKDYTNFLRHLRLTLLFRHSIGLSDWSLVKQYYSRLRMGIGLPR